MLAARLKLPLMMASLAAIGGAWAQTDDLKPFPAPAAGMQRFVIRLPAVPQPNDHKVEVMVGKTLQVDCNRQMFSAKVTQKVAQGWGFPYYVVGQLKGPASTMMACPPDAPKHEEFVRAKLRGWNCCATTRSCRSSSMHPKASRSASACGALREPPSLPNRNEARAVFGAPARGATSTV